MNRVSFKKLLKQSFLEFQSLFMSFRFNKKSKIALEEANNRLNSVYSFSDKINNTTIINKRATYITNDIDKYTSLSIITCAYNTDEKLLRKCLNSLINQNTKYQYEIILIDDGSQNNTLDVIKNMRVVVKK